ncbi:MAG: hypothetical protein GQ470_01585 [Gammaproteobacteria bacterium]|nr:hypothetical protein [Gammaproteobacteria bacterium]
MNLIKYQVNLDDGREFFFEVDLERDEQASMAPPGEHAQWTRLDCHRCSNCPLDSSQATHCPAAVDIENIAENFVQTMSIARADVWVHTNDRSYFKNCDSQTFLKSLFGLVMATSGCPILSRLKPMAQFHLPFATVEETVHRLIGSYLISQYLNYKEESVAPDWDLKGIDALYKELKTVNIDFMTRMRTASQEDASINAMQSYVSISSIVGMGVDDILSKLLPLLKKGL